MYHNVYLDMSVFYFQTCCDALKVTAEAGGAPPKRLWVGGCSGGFTHQMYKDNFAQSFAF
jgi:hypothetical protein